MIEANNPSLRSWLEIPANSDFPIQNLPFGIFSTASLSARVGVAIGDQVLNLSALFAAGFLRTSKELPFTESDYSASTLNPIINHGKAATRLLRARISTLLNADSSELRVATDSHAS